MDKVEKILQKWHNSRQPVPQEELWPVLNRYFPEMWGVGGRGSHNIKVSHPKLRGLPGYGPNGDFIIVVSHGQQVKRWYLKDLMEAIEIVRDDK